MSFDKRNFVIFSIEEGIVILLFSNAGAALFVYSSGVSPKLFSVEAVFDPWTYTSSLPTKASYVGTAYLAVRKEAQLPFFLHY